MITHKLLAVFSSNTNSPRLYKAGIRRALAVNDAGQGSIEFEANNVVYVLGKQGKTIEHKCIATLVYSNGRFVEIKNIQKKSNLSDRFSPKGNRTKLCFQPRVIEDVFENGFPRDLNTYNIQKLRRLFKGSSGVFGGDSFQIRVTSSGVDMLNASSALMKCRDISLLDYDDSLKSYDMKIRVYSEEKKIFYLKSGYLVVDDNFVVGIRWKHLKQHIDYAPFKEFLVPVKLRPRLSKLIQERKLYISEAENDKDKPIMLIGHDFLFNLFDSNNEYIRKMFETGEIQETLDRDLLPAGVFFEQALAFCQSYPLFLYDLVDWMNTQDIVDGAINKLLRKPEHIAENNTFSHEISLLFEKNKDIAFGIQFYPYRNKTDKFALLFFIVLASEHFEILLDFDFPGSKFLENFLFEYRIEKNKDRTCSLKIFNSDPPEFLAFISTIKKLTAHLRQLIDNDPEPYLSMELSSDNPVERSTIELKNTIVDEKNRAHKDIKQLLKIAMRLGNYQEIIRLAKKVTIKQRHVLCDSVTFLNIVLAAENLTFRELFYLRTNAKLNMSILDYVFRLGELTSSNVLSLNVGGIYKAHWVISETLKGFISASDSQIFLNSIEDDYDELLSVYLQKRKSAAKKSSGKCDLKHESLKDIICDISSGLDQFIPAISIEDRETAYPAYDELKKALVEFGMRIAGNAINAVGRFIFPNRFDSQVWGVDSQLSNDLIKLVSLANQYIDFDNIPKGIKRVCEFYWRKNCLSLPIVHPFLVLETEFQFCDEKYLDERPLVTVNEFDKLHWRLFMYKLFETLPFPMDEYLSHSELILHSVNENWVFYLELFRDFESQAANKLFFMEADDRQQALSHQLKQAINEQDSETVMKSFQALYTLYHVDKDDYSSLLDFYVNHVKGDALLKVIRSLSSTLL